MKSETMKKEGNAKNIGCLIYYKTEYKYQICGSLKYQDSKMEREDLDKSLNYHC